MNLRLMAVSKLAAVAFAVAEEPIVLELDSGGQLLVFIREVDLDA